MSIRKILIFNENINSEQRTIEISNILYPEAMKKMIQLIDEVRSNDSDVIWFIEHDHCYTIGMSGADEEILESTSVPIYHTNRGGRVTYHGPGQLIVYPIINIHERGINVSEYIKLLQIAIINSLAVFGVISVIGESEDAIGVWINGGDNEKIASIGVRIQKGIAFHGVAINISPDLEYFDRIIPCGLRDVKMTSVEKLGVNISIDQFAEIFYKEFLSLIEMAKEGGI